MVGAYAEVTNDNRDLDLITRRSAWKASTEYYSGTGIDDTLDVVKANGAWYRCIVTHKSSGNFEADYKAKKWKVFSWMENLATDILLSRKIIADEIDVDDVKTKILTAEAIAALNIVTKNLTVQDGAKIGSFKIDNGFLYYVKDGSSVYLGDLGVGLISHSSMMRIVDKNNDVISKTSVVIECDHPTNNNPFVPIQDIAFWIKKGSVEIHPTSKMDMPGVLFAGNVRFIDGVWKPTYKFGRGGRGGLNKESPFGLINVTDGSYNIVHELGHLNYTVFITPIRLGVNWNKINWHISLLHRESFTVRFTDSGSENNGVFTDFSFVVIGDNTID